MLHSNPYSYCWNQTTTIGAHRGARRLSIHDADGLFSLLHLFSVALDARCFCQEQLCVLAVVASAGRARRIVRGRLRLSPTGRAPGSCNEHLKLAQALMDERYNFTCTPSASSPSCFSSAALRRLAPTRRPPSSSYGDLHRFSVNSASTLHPLATPILHQLGRTSTQRQLGLDSTRTSSVARPRLNDDLRKQCASLALHQLGNRSSLLQLSCASPSTFQLGGPLRAAPARPRFPEYNFACTPSASSPSCSNSVVLSELLQLGRASPSTTSHVRLRPRLRAALARPRSADLLQLGHERRLRPAPLRPPPSAPAMHTDGAATSASNFRTSAALSASAALNNVKLFIDCFSSTYAPATAVRAFLLYNSVQVYNNNSGSPRSPATRTSYTPLPRRFNRDDLDELHAPSQLCAASIRP